MSPDRDAPDLCVVGAGSGGLSVSAGAAAFGARVVLVERGRMGGDCLHYGCVPSKALVAAARRAADIRTAGILGIHAGEPRIDFPAVMAHVRGVIADIAPFDSAERFRKLGVDVIEAEGRFTDARTLVAGGRIIRPRRFVIATGSSPRIPAIEGLSRVPFLTNETIFDLVALPAHLVVLGGGPIGIELGQAFRRLGSAVTIVDKGAMLAAHDADLVGVVRERLVADGVTLMEGTDVRSVSANGTSIAVDLGAGNARARIEGSHLLVAAGRTPNVNGLGLDAAGIATGQKGILVGRDLRTANARAYAIGDVAGGPQFTHAANHQAGLVLRALLFRLPVAFDPDAIPRTTYADPEIGEAGLTEAEARARGLAADVVTLPFSQNDRARTERHTDGLLKMVIGRRGRLLGVGIVGEKAGELTHLFSLAISRRMSAAALQSYVAPYPTYGETGKKAAVSHLAPYAAHGLVRMAVRLLARMG